jgi:hypothetical protein
MTGHAPALTGTPPTSSLPSSPEPPGKLRVWQAHGVIVAAIGTRYLWVGQG